MPIMMILLVRRSWLSGNFRCACVEGGGMQVMIDPLLVFAATFDTDIKIAIMYLFLCYPTMSCNDIVLMTGEKKENVITSLWRLQMDTIVVNKIEDDRNCYYSLTSSGTASLKVFSEMADFSDRCLK
jgi:hypothetical protein